jgi:uncharacterized protein YacL (UPF0231 family)
MDYEIAFEPEENAYRVHTDVEFAAIAEWITEYLRDKDTLQRVMQAAILAEREGENTNFSHGNFTIVIGRDGVAVKRVLDMSAVTEEIKAMFDTENGFFNASDDGVEAECGLDDLIDLIENWHEVVQ